MNRVMVFGTFDNLHPGHLDYFRQARHFGEELIVIVARDQNVLKIKGRAPQEGEKLRAKNVRQALQEGAYQGRAVLGSLKNRWLVINRYRPDFICLGYDQQVDLTELKSKIAKFRLFCKIRRMRPYYPEKYKSSYCKK
ncbi:MAG: adenylyltransferase/cytidyltransferase family protein [Patescibacteria group bacterium]